MAGSGFTRTTRTDKKTYGRVRFYPDYPDAAALSEKQKNGRVRFYPDYPDGKTHGRVRFYPDYPDGF